MKYRIAAWVLLGVTTLVAGDTPAGERPRACPGLELVQQRAAKVFPPGTVIKEVRPAAVDHLCEVRVVYQGQTRFFYTDSSGDHFLMGQIIDVVNNRNLTMEATEAAGRLNGEELARLDKLAAFASGKTGPVIYLATDPQCPYCKDAEAVVKEMAKDGLVTVKVLMFPLPMHKGAREQCIALICDQQGWEGLEEGYKSTTSCDKGREQVDATLALLKEKGITATPTFIFPDGSVHTGVMQRDEIVKRLAIEP